MRIIFALPSIFKCAGRVAFFGFGDLGRLCHGGLLNLYHSCASQLLQLAEKFIDLLARFNEFNLERKMVGDFNEAGGMHVVIRAKSGYPFQYGCAGDAAIEEKVDDARISWDP